MSDEEVASNVRESVDRVVVAGEDETDAGKKTGRILGVSSDENDVADDSEVRPSTENGEGRRGEGDDSEPDSTSFGTDGEPDYKPRKVSTSSSESSSEKGNDDHDDTETTEESSSKQDHHEKSSSFSTSKGGKADSGSSSSDTDDDVSKAVIDTDEFNNDEDSEFQARPIPSIRKISPTTVQEELNQEELELSKRETITLEEEEADAAAQTAQAGVHEVEQSVGKEEEECRKEIVTSVPSFEENISGSHAAAESAVDPVLTSSAASTSDDENRCVGEDVQATSKTRPSNGTAEIKRPQFRTTPLASNCSNLSDKENPASSTEKSKVKQEIRSNGRDTSPIETNHSTSSSHSPLPTRANANKLTKIYTEALENNNITTNRISNTEGHAAERVKPTKDITQIYTQNVCKAYTPPSSPKPIPSRNKDITQLYTGGLQSNKSPSNHINSPCMSADKLTPKKHNLSTAVNKDAIRQAYDDVRSDSSETEWAVFKFDGNILEATATGTDFNEFKALFGNEDRGFGYIRISTGDEMSKRAKFVFVTWVGPSVSVMKKAKMSTDKALMKDIIQNLSVELQLENHTEFSHDYFKNQVDKAAGARYGTGERAL